MRFGYTFVWVDDVERTVEFYERAFGLRRRFLAENGPMGLYAELDTGETTLAVADTREARALFPEGYRGHDPAEPPSAFQVSFITDDVAEAYARALRTGATSQAEPREQPWGQTVARVRDPNGVLVSLVTAPPRPRE